MAGCCDTVQDLLTSVNDLDKCIWMAYVGRSDAFVEVVRMHLWKSSGCYVYECRVPLLEVVRIGETRHVYFWGNLDEGDPDDNACHVSP